MNLYTADESLRNTKHMYNYVPIYLHFISSPRYITYNLKKCVLQPEERVLFRVSWAKHGEGKFSVAEIAVQMSVISPHWNGA